MKQQGGEAEFAGGLALGPIQHKTIGTILGTNYGKDVKKEGETQRAVEKKKE